MIDDKTANTWAQNAHWAGGLAWVFGSIVLFGFSWWFVVGAVVATAIKEFWYDYRFETVDERGSSLQDFLFYQLGIWVAVISYFVSHCFGHWILCRGGNL